MQLLYVICKKMCIKVSIYSYMYYLCILGLEKFTQIDFKLCKKSEWMNALMNKKVAQFSGDAKITAEIVIEDGKKVEGARLCNSMTSRETSSNGKIVDQKGSRPTNSPSHLCAKILSKGEVNRRAIATSSSCKNSSHKWTFPSSLKNSVEIRRESSSKYEL